MDDETRGLIEGALETVGKLRELVEKVGMRSIRARHVVESAVREACERDALSRVASARAEAGTRMRVGAAGVVTSAAWTAHDRSGSDDHSSAVCNALIAVADDILRLPLEPTDEASLGWVKGIDPRYDGLRRRYDDLCESKRAMAQRYQDEIDGLKATFGVLQMRQEEVVRDRDRLRDLLSEAKKDLEKLAAAR